MIAKTVAIIDIFAHGAMVMWTVSGAILAAAIRRGAERPPAARSVHHELRPFYLPCVVFTTAESFANGGLFMYVDGAGIADHASTVVAAAVGVMIWFAYRNIDDDDRWKRRRKKAAAKITAAAGRLVVVPS